MSKAVKDLVLKAAQLDRGDLEELAQQVAALCGIVAVEVTPEEKGAAANWYRAFESAVMAVRHIPLKKFVAVRNTPSEWKSFSE
ncbi:MAG: hypothetical protein ACREIC_31175, partial [Limisphaerales bacterium]